MTHCECEHGSHLNDVGPAAHLLNPHGYGCAVSETRPVKTPFGTFEICLACSSAGHMRDPDVRACWDSCDDGKASPRPNRGEAERDAMTKTERSILVLVAREVGFPAEYLDRLIRTKPRGLAITPAVARTIMLDIMSDPRWPTLTGLPR